MKIKIVSKKISETTTPKKFKLRLVERKNSLNENTNSSTLRATIKPEDFLKITLDGETFEYVQSFVNNKKSVNDAIGETTLESRKKYVSDVLSTDSRDVVNLILRGLNFMSPLQDAPGYGYYDEKNPDNPSLAVEVYGDDGKVKNHSGRARNLFLWLTSKNTSPVDIYFSNVNISDPKQLTKIVSQFDESVSIPGSSLKVLSSSGESYPTVANFITRVGKYATRDSIKKFNESHIVEVSGERGSVGKIIQDGMFETCLYRTSFEKVNKDLPQDEYWTEVKKHLFDKSDGPVTVIKK